LCQLAGIACGISCCFGGLTVKMVITAIVIGCSYRKYYVFGWFDYDK